MPSILVRITFLNPENDRGWSEHASRSIAEANRIYSQHGYFIRESGRTNVPDARARELLRRDLRDDAAGLNASNRREARANRNEFYRLAALSGIEYSLQAAEVVAVQGVTGRASQEAIAIMTRYRRWGEAAVFYVPRIISPNCSGHTLCPPIYGNLPMNVEGIFVKPDCEISTIAHELGHLLMHTGHCANPDPHETMNGCHCAPVGNLLYGDADTRTGNEITLRQLTRIERVGARYIH